MKILFIYIIALFLGGINISYAQTVYECSHADGSMEYRADFRDGCVVSKLKKTEGYTSVIDSGNIPYYEDNRSVNGYPTPISPLSPSAERRLNDAKKALEEGKKIRYGNERNHAKYQERIRKLEEDVIKAGGQVEK